LSGLQSSYLHFPSSWDHRHGPLPCLAFNFKTVG
jgi:hypothetical protein